MEPEVAFGIVLRRLRLERGLSQEKLALDADLQRNYISLLERGLNSATIRTIFKLSAVLEVSVADLLAQVEGWVQSNGGKGERR
ncbi:XRE family transcriptional regulator [Pseudolysobacter antarcticus]|uniref:XRE family transcriptional regulator n=1 Tax=Pseudolysobacter antarcticus TaxID=2511995 RepID=A0A411HJN8_9GAMM|nr:helix-turn-helix transcriptional regulator [Pseudolysobacter antarcticus]QBB70624.1 XRE family transcriptional regulator [Pseudolysobacter antarcticus]